MIVCQLSFEVVPPMKISKIFDKGIFTEPKLIFVIKKSNSKTDRIIKCLVYVLEEFN